MWYDVVLEMEHTEGTFMTEAEKRMHRVCFTGHRMADKKRPGKRNPPGNC